MKALKYLLYPFSFLYSAVMHLRNYFYDVGKKKSHKFDVLTISVGNLRVGGTGKTPLSEYLINLLINNNLKPSYLSRGYGRKSKGYREVSVNSDTTEVGDEALQIKQKFPNIPVGVCESRALGIPFVLAQQEGVSVVVLDDAYQHRSVFPHLNVLLTAYGDLFSDDYVLPLGRLREARSGAKRADVVVVTKCPKLSDEEKELITQRLKKYSNPDAPVLFARLKYDAPKWELGTKNHTTSAIVVSAIAHNEIFRKHCETIFSVEKHFYFSDHHEFTMEEIKEIVNFSLENKNIPLITTEKDWQRLKKHSDILEKNHVSVAVIGISVALNHPQTFWDKIVEAQSNI